MYGPDAFCKLLVRDVEAVCMHVSGLPGGPLPKHARSLDRTDARHLRDLFAQHRLLYERLDRCFDQVDALFDRMQVLQQFSQQRLTERRQFVGALAE
jgi:hypothetical protein